MSKPSLVLVPGSMHTTEHFEPLKQDLESHGFRTIAFTLPSTQDPGSKPATLEDDTNAIRSAALSELDKGNDVVVVAHSFGGVPANNAFQGLDAKSRRAAGHSTSVKTLVFIAGIPLPVGGSMLATIGGKPSPMQDLRTPEFCWIGKLGGEHYFYNDMSEADAKHWSSKLKVQSWEAYRGETSYASYLDIPCYYLRTKRDNSFPYEGQGGLIAGARAAGAQIEEESIDSDHSPFLGKNLEKTSEFIRKAAVAKHS